MLRRSFRSVSTVDEAEMVLRTFSYLSRVTTALRPGELTQIRLASETFNDRNQVTGLLLCDGKHFAQIIEGPELGLSLARVRIMKDCRHEIMCVGREAIIARRQFSDWSLRVLDVSPLPADEAMADYITVSSQTGVHPEIAQFFCNEIVK